MKVIRTVTTMNPKGEPEVYLAGEEIPDWLAEKLAKGNPKCLEGYVAPEPDAPAPKRAKTSPRVASAGKLTKTVENAPGDKFKDMPMADLEEYALKKGVENPDEYESREELIAAILGVGKKPVSVADVSFD